MKKSKKILGLFDLNKPGRGVTKEEAAQEQKKQYSLANFFRICGRRFSFLVILNLLFVFTNLFLFAGLLALTGNFDTPHLVPVTTTYQSLFGVSQYGFSPLTAGLWGIGGSLSSIGYASTTTYILYGVAALTLFTFGLTNTGLAYVLRNLSRRESPDLVDYFRAMKANFWQGLFLGIIDIVFLAVFIWAGFFYYYQSAGGFGFLLLYYLSLFVGFLYLMMRFFMYQLLVTFKLSMWKIIKNSYILAVAGIKRNIVALIGGALLLVLNYVMFLVYAPIGALLPFLLTPVATSFMGAYAAYPTVKRLMIDPYYASEAPGQTPTAAKQEEEPIFVDRG